MKPTVRQIRKELAILIKKKHKTCATEKEKNKAVEDARQEINVKYGKGWRETYPEFERGKGYDFSRPFDAQDLGDEWDHYPWSANDF